MIYWVNRTVKNPFQSFKQHCIFYNFPGKTFKISIVHYIFIIEIYLGTQFKLASHEQELKIAILSQDCTLFFLDLGTMNVSTLQQ